MGVYVYTIFHKLELVTRREMEKLFWLHFTGNIKCQYLEKNWMKIIENMEKLRNQFEHIFKSNV